MEAVNNLTINEIPEVLKEKIYRERQLMYRTEDAKGHISDLGYDDVLGEEDAKIIADRFLQKYDCNLTENDMFACIIEDYVSNRQFATNKE